MGSSGRRWRGWWFVEWRGQDHEPDVGDDNARRNHNDDRNSAGELERGESSRAGHRSHDDDDVDDHANDDDHGDQGQVGEWARENHGNADYQRDHGYGRDGAQRSASARRYDRYRWSFSLYSNCHSESAHDGGKRYDEDGYRLLRDNIRATHSDSH
jgi:hypothetical protein